ncbi:20495_t:CDS:2 [Rhizophagus irregularis]|nr:20495_t:CDS:2 [Rhizophagus irregularis]
MSSDPSFEEVKEYNIEQLITYLRTKILNFEENDFAIFRNQRINGQTIVNMTQKGFSEPPFNFVYGIAKNLSNLIDELKSQRSLSLNEILSYILPPIKYPPYASTSISSTKVSGDWPIKIMRWKEFKSEANEYNFVGQEKFERPYLIENLKAIVKSNVETAMEDTYISPFKPDYTCYLKTINNLLKQILAIEIRRYIVIEGFENFDDEDLKRQSSSYYSSNAISMFFGHWKTWQQDYNKITEQDFDFSEFKFKSFLGCGQTGGTYACEFYGQIIALKVLNLYKNSQFLNQMQKEIEIYKLLFKIQEIYIPKLVCYGYYEIGYVMGITIVGTKLSFHKIEQWQKNKALRALEIIHSHNILHNDIREENILINEKNNIYIIDFGKSIKTDKKNLFCKEKSELSHLLNYYM